MSKRPLKILFDAVPLAQARPTGVGRAAAGLVQALADEYPDDIVLVGHYFDFLGRKGVIAHLPQAPNIHYRRTMILPGKVFNMLRRLRIPVFYEFLVKDRGDFILFPNYIGWPSLFRTPSAPYVHDTTYIDLPEYVNKTNLYDLRVLMPGTFRRSSFAITDTIASQNGFADAYPDYNKPFVIAHIPLVGASVISEAEARRRIDSLGITKPYFLFFGTLEPRKNLLGLLQAYQSLPAEIAEKYQLVIGGGKGWNDEEIAKTLEDTSKSNPSIIQTGYVSDEDRAALFMNATLYVMPSYYEGFGMPLLEAMFYKTPIVASDIPVLHEVAEDAALYSDTSAESIRKAIADLASDKKLQEQLVKNGVKRLGNFSWPEIARNVYAAIQKSLTSSDRL